MRKLLTILLLFLGSLSIHSQYVKLPTIDLYDTGSMTSFLNTIREASEVDHELANYMLPIIKKLRNTYDSGDYRSCKSNIDYIFNKITFYKRQYWIYSHLYFLRGMSLMQLGEEDDGIWNLIQAREAENTDAVDALKNYFSQYCNRAYQCLINKQYNECLLQVNRALNTTYYNYYIYEIGGIAYENTNFFESATKYYKLARKYGSPNAKEMLKQLRIHRKEYKKTLK